MSVTEKFETMEYGPASESDAKAKEWLAKHQGKFGHYIGGKFVKPKGRGNFVSYNPATGEKLAELTNGNAADVDAAVKSARKAQADWAGLGGHARARFLYAIARLVQKHSRILAVLESLDNGKPIREARDIDIPLVARHFYHHAGWAQLMSSEFAGYGAVGVIGQVIPWNFPLLMLAWKVAPALAAGNTVVLKPAEYTSLTALMFAELCSEAGLPAGVVNIVTGEGATGAAIVAHDDCDKLAFTGSTAVGRLIRETAAGTGKKLTLELGGKSPYIVFDDADIDGAVEGLVDAIWFNQGQVCCAGSRLLIHEGIADKFHDKVKVRMSKLRIGNSLDKCIDMGAIVDEVQRVQIDKLVQQGKAEGATVWQPDTKLPSEGVFYPPTLITDVGTSNVCVREEIFGPVLTSITFRTQKEAIELANNSRYGLAASVWSENINRALEVSPKLKAGIVWVNGANMFDAACGFGGYRESGIGREGGREGMYEYLKPDYEKKLKVWSPIAVPKNIDMPTGTFGTPSLDRTAKHYIGGKQTRPDGAGSTAIADHTGAFADLVAEGNYKDIRNAVEAASKAAGWAGTTGHLKAQILYYIAENLSFRADEFEKRLKSLTGATAAKAKAEVEKSIERLFTWAAWADKYDGAVHTPPMRGVTLAMNEPVGTLAIVCPDEAPLLAMVSLVGPAIAMGNTTIVVPSERYPLLATDFYQILETSDLPGGVVNIVTGSRDALSPPLAKHLNVDGMWYFGSSEGSKMVEFEAAENMKRSWVSFGKAYDWMSDEQVAGKHVLRHATEVKNIWIPYGDQT